MTDTDPMAVWLVGVVVLFVVAFAGAALIQAAQQPREAAIVMGAIVLGLIVPYVVGRLFLRWLF